MGPRFFTNLLDDYNGQLGLFWSKAAMTILVSFAYGSPFRGYASMGPSSGHWDIRENQLRSPKKDFYFGKQFIKYIGSFVSTSSSILVCHDMRSLELQSWRGTADTLRWPTTKSKSLGCIGGLVSWASNSWFGLRSWSQCHGMELRIGLCA